MNPAAGQGSLRYGRETIWDSYYSVRLFPGPFAAIEVQHVQNPAYNGDRGPVWISSLRLHTEIGRETFRQRGH